MDGQIRHLQTVLDSVLTDVVALKQENQQLKNEYNQQQSKMALLENQLKTVQSENRMMNVSLSKLQSAGTNNHLLTFTFKFS
jgi:chromosome segregation ATPase